MYRIALASIVFVSVNSVADAAPWEEVTDSTIGVTGEWSNKVELADIDDDGDVDILFANGGNFTSAGTPVLNRVFLNDGVGGFTEATAAVFGATGDLTRVIKVRDLNGDGRSVGMAAGADCPGDAYLQEGDFRHRLFTDCDRRTVGLSSRAPGL